MAAAGEPASPPREAEDELAQLRAENTRLRAQLKAQRSEVGDLRKRVGVARGRAAWSHCSSWC